MCQPRSSENRAGRVEHFDIAQDRLRGFTDQTVRGCRTTLGSLLRATMLCPLIVFLHTTAHAEFDLSDWQWKSNVETRHAVGFVGIEVSPYVFDQSQADLKDLRILDDNGDLIPHVILWGDPRKVVTKTQWRDASIINKTFEPHQFARATLDFQHRIVKNRIRVRTSGRNYRRKVSVEGSPNGTDWEYLTEDDWLFDVSLTENRFELNTLNLPENDFRYLRLTVFNMEDDPRTIQIESVAAVQHVELLKSEIQSAPIDILSVTSFPKKKQTTVLLDSHFRNLPISKIEFQIGDPFFYRAYELTGRNQEIETVQRRTETGFSAIQREAPWRSIDRGILHRIIEGDETKSKFTIVSRTIPYRFLQLNIFNGDDPPLEIIGVSAFMRKARLVFHCERDKQYLLVGGNSNARAPEFDIAKSVRGLEDADLLTFPAGPLTAIEPTVEERPWTEEHTLLIWAALLLLVAAMLAVIFKSLRTLKDDPTQQE